VGASKGSQIDEPESRLLCCNWRRGGKQYRQYDSRSDERCQSVRISEIRFHLDPPVAFHESDIGLRQMDFGLPVTRRVKTGFTLKLNIVSHELFATRKSV